MILKTKTILIVGAFSGIGRYMSLELSHYQNLFCLTKVIFLKSADGFDTKKYKWDNREKIGLFLKLMVKFNREIFNVK